MCFADAGSTNRTHINEKMVKTRSPQRLRFGDRIRILKAVTGVCVRG